MKTRAATVDDLTGTGRAAAAYVRGYRERTGHGPSWGELRRHAGWPREVTDDRERSKPWEVTRQRRARLASLRWCG